MSLMSMCPKYFLVLNLQEMAFDANDLLASATKNLEDPANDQKEEAIDKVWMRNPYVADLRRWKITKTAADIAKDIDRPVRTCKTFR